MPSLKKKEGAEDVPGWGAARGGPIGLVGLAR
eukprot:CAMPEP_0204596942 /NCGR_PEP_ID=MMETSP0661-20131031/53534_1 /ASSEMBLY_ACC=CAM_ASM_000606 /TAXON_ID=109239 /ORGANISM="Alexandrium margalefi, Strain AMGDE01CS-322" /LENGTH=31 /DNA_ID= /DNA_START= /DNA_END= /DNA_ORIENTATION=